MNYHLLDYFEKAFSQFKTSIVKFLPHFVGAIAVILLGILMARLFQALTNRFLRNLGRFIPIRKIQIHLQQDRMERTAGLISKILYWIVLFFFLTVATEVLGLPVVTTWFGGITSYLPKILVAVLICVSGIIGGILLRDVIEAAAASVGITYGNILSKLAQYIIPLITIFIAIDHIGIEIAFLTSMILILLSAMLLGSALAFGLGAKISVSNILASYYLQKVYKSGQIVKIGEMKGKIIQITPIAVILDTAEGQVYVPARQFNEMTSMLLREEIQDE
jgi:hypothetical protein